MPGAILETEGLTREFRGFVAVKDVALRVEEHTIHALIGPNGAGKTTCFYMIVGLVPADAGQILLDGKDITSQPMYARAKHGVGYLPQEPSVFRRLSVADNIRLVLELRTDLDRNGRERELGELMEELQISHVAEQIGASLSGGDLRGLNLAGHLAGQ